MGKIVIKKRVSLEFLGDEYKEAYIDFQKIPALDFEEIESDRKKFEEDGVEAIKFLLGVLKRQFINGLFPDDDGTLQPVTKDDLDGLDAESILECFRIMTGQEIDPKAETPSRSQSTTEATTGE